MVPLGVLPDRLRSPRVVSAKIAVHTGLVLTFHWEAVVSVMMNESGGVESAGDEPVGEAMMLTAPRRLLHQSSSTER